MFIYRWIYYCIMNSKTMIIGVMLVLILVSISQGVQLNEIKEKVDGKKLVNVESTDTDSTHTALPLDIEKLPPMIGGC